MNKKELLPPPEPTTERKFRQGQLVGDLAKSLFPDGIDLSEKDFGENLKLTQENVLNRKTIFEAGIKASRGTGEIYSRTDVLLPTEDGRWDLIEVKSGTSVKEENIDDVSFQRFCYASAGLAIRKCVLMHVNNQYIKNGSIDVRELLTSADVTDLVEERMVGIEPRIEEMHAVIDSHEQPEQRVGPFCNKPYECDLKNSCWDFLPDGNVFELYRGGKKCFDLLQSGVVLISDVPDTIKLNAKQVIQKACAISGEPHINVNGIGRFMDGLNYPLCFLDFETFDSAVPYFDGTKPYQKIPFQFSLHLQESEGADPSHIPFLAENTSDPRPELLGLLRDSLGDTGDIVVYNAPFETGRLAECAEAFPEYKTWIEKNVLPRIKDLLVPFRDFHYYDPKQRGSASLKSVLPVMSNLSYDEMEIRDGLQASIEFERITFESDVSGEKRAGVREALLDYCKQDTFAEIVILEKLRILAEG